MKQVRLNRLEIWIADHAVPVFLVVAALIIAGAVAVFVTYQKQDDTADQVRVIAPQVTKVSRAICDQQSLSHPDRANRCAERIRVGLINCRRVQRCRAALLAILTYPPPADRAEETSPSTSGGGDAFQPSTGKQQPGPGSQPGQPGGQGKGGGQGGSPAPSPAAPGPAAPGGGPPAGAPGKGPPAAPGGGSSSDAGVEICVLERTCIGADVDLKPKGLLP